MHHTDTLMARQYELEAEMVNRGIHRYRKDYQRATEKNAFGGDLPRHTHQQDRDRADGRSDQQVGGKKPSAGGGRRNRSAV